MRGYNSGEGQPEKVEKMLSFGPCDIAQYSGGKLTWCRVERIWFSNAKPFSGVRLCDNSREMDNERFRFGLFEFDIATRELRREGILVRLQSQPARILSCLIERHGQVVSREDLCQAVWGAGTFVDYERGLNFCIAQVRSALGDDSTTPRYVQTIPRRGYQFIAPVEQIAIFPEPTEAASAARKFPTKIIAACCALGLLLAAGLCAGYWARFRQEPKRPAVIAVARFDNETNDTGMTQFSDGITDSVVEQLTTQSHDQYEVIGNASILRVPRDQRDLSAISSSLHAGYIVLGQVQSSNSQTRVLAHLIRLPDQKHISVARLDRSLGNPLSVELEISQEIAAQFSQRVVMDLSRNPSSPAPSK
jgi:DNA-binding winged helix-turn-helix (wHTH) protein/TolB-like protein